MSADMKTLDYLDAVRNSTTFRQFRILLAVAASCAIFYTIGTRLMVMPQMGSAEILAVGPLGSWVAPASLIAALLLSMLVSAVITFPDGPHTGLFAAAAGLCALAVRIGTIKFLLLSQYHHLSAAYLPLVAQSVFFLIWVLLAALAARVMQSWFTTARPWPLSVGVPWPLHHDADATVPEGFPSSTDWLVRTNREGKPARPGFVDGVFALLMIILIALVMEFITLRSLEPGQAIFALIISFYVAAFAAGLVFKRAPDVIYLSAPLVTAAISYLVSWHMKSPYPGYPGFAPADALPVYYASAGVVGALVGYYSAMRAVHHSALEQSHADQTKGN